jgi:hypothetical protein
MYHIYGLVDPNGPELFYVGCTSRPTARLTKHRLYYDKDQAKRLKEKIKAIRTSGKLTEMVILERTEDKSRENVWIEYFSWLGLVNVVRQPKIAPRGKKKHAELAAIARQSWERKRQLHQYKRPHANPKEEERRRMLATA